MEEAKIESLNLRIKELERHIEMLWAAVEVLTKKELQIKDVKNDFGHTIPE